MEQKKELLSSFNQDNPSDNDADKIWRGKGRKKHEKKMKSVHHKYFFSFAIMSTELPVFSKEENWQM